MTEESKTVSVPAAELNAVNCLLIGFIHDLTPEPDSLADVEVSVETLSALANLANTFVPNVKHEVGEGYELAYIKDTLEGYKCQ